MQITLNLYRNIDGTDRLMGQAEMTVDGAADALEIWADNGTMVEVVDTTPNVTAFTLPVAPPQPEPFLGYCSEAGW